MSRFKAKLLVCGMVLAGAGPDAFAQDTRDGKLDEIVVTATKTEQNLQKVPVAVTAFTAEKIQEAGISNTEDIAALTPALHTFNISSPFTTNLQLRGIGSAQSDPSLEASTGLFVDGVFIGRTGLATSDLTDIERIEVLQGPQGTLYGKNTNAGAISVITKRPNLEEMERYISASFGSFDRRELTAAVSAPLSDTLAFRLSGNVHVEDGYIENISGDDGNSHDDWNIQAKLLWQPSDNLSILLGGTHIERDNSCCMPDATQGEDALNRLAALGLEGADIPNDPFDYTVATDQQAEFLMESDMVTAHVDYDAGWGKFTSITAWNEYEFTQTIDTDRSQLDIFRVAPELGAGDSFSQELRLDTSIGEDLDLQVGLFYYDQTIISGNGTEPGLTLGDDFLPIATQFISPQIALIAQPGDTLFGQGVWDSETFAIFGQATWHATENLHLTGGLRWTDEKREADLFAASESTALAVVAGVRGPFVDRFANPIDAEFERSFDNIDWLAKAVYDLTDDTIVYASVTTGTKSGNFNGVSGTEDQREFDDEFTTSYELGLKSTFADSRVRVNVAAFYTEVDDFQFQQGIPTGGSIVSNEGKVEVSGIDLQMQASPFQGLILEAGVLYMDKYDVVSGPNAGEELNTTADWTTNFAATYTHPIASGELYMRGDYQHMGDHVTNAVTPEETIAIQDKTLVNARLGWRNGEWNVSVWARNLTDDVYSGFTSPIQPFGGSRAFFLTPPRTFGATLRYDF